MRIAGILFCILLLTACSQSAGTMTPGLGSSAPSAMKTFSGGQIYRELYGFKGGPNDGKWPAGRLVALDGTIYGVDTEAGANGKGIVYAVDASGPSTSSTTLPDTPTVTFPKTLRPSKGRSTAPPTPAERTVTVPCLCVTTSGSERVLYSFKGGTRRKRAHGVIAANGRLYGATPNGGTSNEGTIFSIDPVSGSKRVLYNFQGGSDGANPSGNLFAKGGASTVRRARAAAPHVTPSVAARSLR